MTAWQIYWVMQLDAISGTANLFAWCGIFAALGLSVWNGASRFDTESYPSLCDVDARKAACADRSALRRKVIVWTIPLCLLATFIPSTKTAAAMIVIPAIVNNETLRAEAGDMYQLAKQALREAVGAKKAEPKE